MAATGEQWCWKEAGLNKKPSGAILRKLLTFELGMAYSPCKKEAKDASILCEVPCQKGNERP
jgi:hypothetical protein